MFKVNYDYFVSVCNDMFHAWLPVGQQTVRQGIYENKPWECIVKRVSEDVVVFRRVF